MIFSSSRNIHQYLTLIRLEASTIPDVMIAENPAIVVRRGYVEQMANSHWVTSHIFNQ